MEVYQSKKTAEELEFALGAIPSIGANGNWFIGETDTGVYACGVKVEGAEVGQTIVVKAVDENGVPTEWEAANLEVPDEYVTIFHKKFETVVANTDEWGGEYFQHAQRHFWCTDIDGNDLELDGIYIRLVTPTQTENIVTSGELKIFVGKGKAEWWKSYGGGDQEQPYVGIASLVRDTQTWSAFDYDLRKRTLKAAHKYGVAMNGNYHQTSEVSAISFEYAVATNAWDCWNGLEMFLVSGSFPAGTEMLIYGRKLNPNKIPAIPKWGVIE